jgi:hypothetical protein
MKQYGGEDVKDYRFTASPHDWDNNVTRNNGGLAFNANPLGINATLSRG